MWGLTNLFLTFISGFKLPLLQRAGILISLKFLMLLVHCHCWAMMLATLLLLQSQLLICLPALLNFSLMPTCQHSMVVLCLNRWHLHGLNKRAKAKLVLQKFRWHLVTILFHVLIIISVSIFACMHQLVIARKEFLHLNQ